MEIAVRSDVEQCGKSNVSSASAFEFFYSWSIEDADGDTISTTNLVSNDPRQLRIPPGTLIPDPRPYLVTAKVEAQAANRQLSPVERQFEIKVNPSPVRATIDGGDRSVGMNNIMIIDASQSKSPDDLSQESSLWNVVYEYS
jgi:hypothetical protein